MGKNKLKSKISRRGFLTGAAGAALSLNVVSKAIAQSAAKKYPKSDKLMRIGVVGGGFGTSFQWHEHPNCKVTAVCELRDDRMIRLMDTYGCDKTYKDYSMMLKDKNVDAVAVFTPAPVHVTMAVEAMEAGKHVISAVPAGVNQEECERLLEAVKRTGKLYMMAETSYYRRQIITARQMAAQKKFGEIFHSESEYHHDGLEALAFNPDGSLTWRHGYPPMLYPTHCTGMIIPVTGERLTEVICTGWGNIEDPMLKSNRWNNPFWSETAFFKTSGGHNAQVGIYWKVASGGTERSSFFGSEMSFHMPRPGMHGTMISYRTKGEEIRNTFSESRMVTEELEVGDHFELLPEPLRHSTGHGGSHTHITHEFVSAIIEQRQPTVNVHEALAYTVPGIIAHASALEGGTLKKIPDYGRA